MSQRIDTLFGQHVCSVREGSLHLGRRHTVFLSHLVHGHPPRERPDDDLDRNACTLDYWLPAQDIWVMSYGTPMLPCVRRHLDSLL